MTQLAVRPERPDYPHFYEGYAVVLNHGRFYGVPDYLDPGEVQDRGQLTVHPAILSAPSRAELEALIRNTDPDWFRQELFGRSVGYNLFRYRGSIWGVPETAGAVDLDKDQDCQWAGVIRGDTCAEVQERIRAGAKSVPVEFAGWLPIFEFSGNCGRHPQFRHTAEPPPGYRFTCSAPPRAATGSWWSRRLGRLSRQLRRATQGLVRLVRPVLRPFRFRSGGKLRDQVRVLASMSRLLVRLLRSGAGLGAVLRFLRSRHYQSQLLLARSRNLVFLTSMPYTYGQNPWVIEIEDPTTLFYPLIHNGGTYHVRIKESPYFPVVKALLESEECRGILTHMKSTADMLPTLFGSEVINAKIHYHPLGVKLPARWQQHEESENLNLVFINSWCQVAGNLYVRGGLDILEAFAILQQRYPHLRLTLRTHLPLLDKHYQQIIESCWVRVIDRFLPPEELEGLLAESHIFLLPAARVHVVSLLQAMSHGLAVVTSDGWGIEEYITHERNGLVVKGRYGKVSWVDHEEGMLREDYEPTYTPDPEVVENLVEEISRLVEDRQLRQRLGRAARRDVETTFNLERWNRGLKELLDRAQVDPSGGR
jgi:glycosyltransferase involved in cell wall biosynthesis